VTLFFKLPAGRDDFPEFKHQISDFLRDQRFQVTELEEVMNGMPVLHASSKMCNVRVMKASSQGWNRDMVMNRASAKDRVVFVFRGVVYREQPVWLTVVGDLWGKFLRSLGLSHNRSHVLGVVATPGCNIEQLPWYDLERALTSMSATGKHSNRFFLATPMSVDRNQI